MPRIIKFKVVCWHVFRNFKTTATNAPSHKPRPCAWQVFAYSFLLFRPCTFRGDRQEQAQPRFPGSEPQVSIPFERIRSGTPLATRGLPYPRGTSTRCFRVRVRPLFLAKVSSCRWMPGRPDTTLSRPLWRFGRIFGLAFHPPSKRRALSALGKPLWTSTLWETVIFH